MIDIVLFEEKKNCCACGVCKAVCPKQAISFSVDKNGFEYPVIDEDVCVKCGKCKTVCAFQNGYIGNKPINVYVAVTSITDIKASASGGIFSAYAKKILDEGGVVFGASYVGTDNTKVAHIEVSSEHDLINLKGSKYVKSDTSEIFSCVKKRLLENRKVLFSGTPCQIAALKAYLGKDYDNLLLIDVICHGVPSLKMYQSYVSFLESKYHKKVNKLFFKDKTRQWGSILRVEFIDKKGKFKNKILTWEQSSYYTLFLKSAIIRENCYSCPYAQEQRISDITIGDFWGIEKCHLELLKENEDKLNMTSGVSCLLVNTKKGKEFFEKYSDAIYCWESDFEKASMQNGNLLRPSENNLDRDIIFQKYREYGYKGVDEFFRKKLGSKYYIIKLKNCIPFGLKKKIKRLF